MKRRATNRDRTSYEAEAVATWRSRRLQHGGFDRRLADALAADPRTDVHALLDLVDRGCPPPLAARILAPLEPRVDPDDDAAGR